MISTRLTVMLSLLSISSFFGKAQMTLDYCLERARENYPLIKKYDIVAQTEIPSLSDINKGWLPRIGLFAQGTAQNSVSAYPEALKSMLDKTGTAPKGMSKLQYKAGVELYQSIWDGGHSKAQRAVQRASTAQTEATLDVEMYAIRERVENIYFGILLMDEQVAKTRSTVGLLEGNLDRMMSMVANGIATQSDADMIEAQLLTLRQKLTDAENAADSYRRLLAIFIGEDVDGKLLIRPEADYPEHDGSERPELRLFDRQIALNTERSRAVEVSVMPRIGFFAQAFYGYPGFNIFESMMKRDPSLNALAGIKVAWNIDSFYTRKNSQKKLSLATDQIQADRELFLFNMKLKSTGEEEKIEGLRKVMKEDARIVELRSNVRRAAESQLKHGIIDTTSLLSKITDENQAILNQTLHEIQLLQAIVRLNNTLNR